MLSKLRKLAAYVYSRTEARDVFFFAGLSLIAAGVSMRFGVDASLIVAGVVMVGVGVFGVRG